VIPVKMSSSKDLEPGPPSLGDTTEAKGNVLQRIKDRIAKSDLANYTSLRPLLDPEWKRFLGNKKVDTCKFLTR